jgi:hypothetical protein
VVPFGFLALGFTFLFSVSGHTQTSPNLRSFAGRSFR